jgi:hypothetical protein
MSHYEVTNEIDDREIGLWKIGAVPLPQTDDPLLEWKNFDEHNVFPFHGHLAHSVYLHEMCPKTREWESRKKFKVV